MLNWVCVCRLKDRVNNNFKITNKFFEDRQVNIWEPQQQTYFHGNVKSRLNSGYAYCRSLQNILTSRFLVQGDSYRTKPIYLAVFQAEQSDVTPCSGSDHRALPGTAGRGAACYVVARLSDARSVCLISLYMDFVLYESPCINQNITRLERCSLCGTLIF
jgi:hypothetical protein